MTPVEVSYCDILNPVRGNPVRIVLRSISSASAATESHRDPIVRPTGLVPVPRPQVSLHAARERP